VKNKKPARAIRTVKLDLILFGISFFGIKAA